MSKRPDLALGRFSLGSGYLITVVIALQLAASTAGGQTFTEDSAKAALWVAIAQREVYNSKNYVALALTNYAISLYAANPNLDPARAADYLGYAEAVYQGHYQDLESKTIKLYRSALSVPFPPAGPVLDFAGQVHDSLSGPPAQDLRYRSGLFQNSSNDRDTLAKAFVLAQADPQKFGKVMEEFLAPQYFKVTPRDSTARMFEKAPTAL